MAIVSVVDVKLDMPRVENKVKNDDFGKHLALEWHRLINPYTPHRTGQLERTVEYRPFEIEYLSEYSQYQYYGMLYVDPIYKVGGFTNDGGITWFSRPGIKKVATTTPLNYLKEHNSQATDHWDVAAKNAGQVEKLVTVINDYLKRL